MFKLIQNLMYRIMDKHLKTLAPRHVDTKFIRVDAEVSEPLD